MNIKYNRFKWIALLMCLTLLVACNPNSDSQLNDGITSTEVVESDTDSQADELNISTDDNVNTEDNTNTEDTTDTITLDQVSYEKNDYYTNWEDENPSYIKLNGTTASVDGTGVVVEDNTVTITTAGVYVLSGILDNGQIVVDAKGGTVKLVLNSIEIYSEDTAPIYVKNAKKTILSLPEGTTNLISDGTEYVLSDSEADEPSSTIFSKDDLTINGTGTLTIQGNYNDGITCKDDLKITGGNITINSIDDGIIGRDLLAVNAGNITIRAGGDGLKSTNDSDTTKGFIVLEDGNFNITAGADGIQAETTLLIYGGRFTIMSGGGSENSSTVANNANNSEGGFWDNKSTDESEDTDSQSAKGVKAGFNITINGGTISIDSSDDALHSNNSIIITNGDLLISSGDDGIHGDTSIDIQGGNINITKSYEGIESAIITITDGEIHVEANDDGINVAGGNDRSSIDGRPGQNSFQSTGNNSLTISGGYTVVNATGDGLDSNGAIYIMGGTVIVNGPTSSGNGALDYDGICEISGGLLIAAGSSGMVQGTSEDSTQNTVVVNLTKTQQAGTLVHLEDSEGNNVLTFAPEKEYQSIVISTSKLKQNMTYTLYSGGTASDMNKDGLYLDGEYDSGTQLTDFTITETVTWLSESGVTTGNNMGGFNSPGNGGGMGGKKNRP